MYNYPQPQPYEQQGYAYPPQSNPQYASPMAPNPQYPQSQQMVIIQNIQSPKKIPNRATSRFTEMVECPNCRHQGLTNTEKGCSGVMWLGACLLCIFLGCPCIALCIDNWKAVRHYCASCHMELGIYEPKSLI
jgi:hypothetical protein